MKHAIVGTEDNAWTVTVICECGDRFTKPTAEAAKKDHAYHFGLSSARASLAAARHPEAGT